MARNEIVMMTEDQWKEEYKSRIRQKLKECLQWLLFGAAMASVPCGMLLHWLIFGYGCQVRGKKMKKFYVMFYDGKEKICGTWEWADNEEQACLFAEIKLICKYPNVRYTSCNVVNVA